PEVAHLGRAAGGERGRVEEQHHGPVLQQGAQAPLLPALIEQLKILNGVADLHASLPWLLRHDDAMRLVSLLPSATEVIYALGLGDDLVGVTFECQRRGDERIVVGGRGTRGMSTGEIDAYVREQLAAGADLYPLHADALAELRPDLIVTQD